MGRNLTSWQEQRADGLLSTLRDNACTHWCSTCADSVKIWYPPRAIATIGEPIDCDVFDGFAARPRSPVFIFSLLQREPDALEFVQGLAATTGCSRTWDVIATPVLSGLHHRYARYDFREGQGKKAGIPRTVTALMGKSRSDIQRFTRSTFL